MHEQYHPRDLLEQAVVGEHAGFDGIACSDHFQPWWEPGHSGQAWIWLGAAAQATVRVPIGPAVTVALKRYHPALIAQGLATLEAMYSGRVLVGLGSGGALKEPPLRGRPAARGFLVGAPRGGRGQNPQGLARQAARPRRPRLQ